MVAIACHGKPDHLTGMHSVAEFETFCVNVDTTEVTFEEAQDAIWDVTADPLGWRSRPRISFTMFPPDCEELTETTLQQVEIFYIVLDAGEYGPCSVPCAGPLGECVSHDGFFEDCEQYAIFVSAAEIEESGIFRPLSHVINHETGHVFGLADTVDLPGVGFDRCLREVNGEVEWIDSIMHNSFQCAPYVSPFDLTLHNRPYPSSDDFQSVDTIGGWGQ